MKADYIIKQGEDLNLSLLATQGDITDVTSVEAALKRAGPRGSIPPSSTPDITSLIVTTTAQPDIGWDLTLPSGITETLAPGFYVTDAKLNLSSGGFIRSSSILIEVRGGVT